VTLPPSRARLARNDAGEKTQEGRERKKRLCSINTCASARPGKNLAGNRGFEWKEKKKGKEENGTSFLSVTRNRLRAMRRLRKEWGGGEHY